MNVSETRRQYGTYRCPVCGHRDGTELEGGNTTREIACPYCRSELEVYGRGARSTRFEARLAQDADRG